MRFANEGTAGATSIEGSCCTAIKAFTPPGASWHNKKFQFPAAVWMRFKKTHRLTKIGFRAWWPNLSENEGNMPKVTKVVGSNDCSNWNTLLQIDNFGGFTSHKEYRTFTIPSENRILSYSCFGLTWASQEGTEGWVRVGDIQMWE